MVKYEDRPDEKQQGIFRQESVQGKTASEIADLIVAAKKGNGPAQATLVQNGFNGIEDAERKIKLLQAFYHETHDDVVHFMKKNGLELLAGHTIESSAFMPVLITVGFDYNNGRNVIWDSKSKVFKVIDF